MAMRPPIPNIALSRRAKIALWTIATLIVLMIALVQLTGVYINFLWFHSLGFSNVYTTIFWTRVVLFAIFGVLMALILGGNMVIAYMLSPPFRPMSPEQQNIERYRSVLEPRRFLVLGVIGVIALFSAGLSAQNNWPTWQLWLHSTSFGQTDPQFHLDVSFYAFDYPAYRLLLGFGFTSLVFAIILSAIVHYLTGAIRLQTPGPKVTPAARRHLTLLVFVFVLLKALAYWLDRYGLVLSDRSKFTGASYTDVHAVLPARTILFWIALIIAAGLIASLWLRNTMLPAIAFISMLVLSILISGIYPAILQSVSVKPNAASKEAPYQERNILATRVAYNIATASVGGGNVTYDDYAAAVNPSTTAIDNANPTVNSIRILDPNVLADTFTQQQQIRNVYGFPAKLDMDRYTIAHHTSDYVVAVRELDASNLNGTQTNWINEHTVYTHGFGFVAAAANQDVTSAPQSYTEKDIPPTGPLGLSQPRVYYGELLPSYSIVGATGTPQEYDGADAAKVTYTGGGGVPLDSLLTRLAFAVNYRQTNFLLNDAASAAGARMIFNRDPRQMVQKVAPFLRVDGDPYPFVDPKTGHILWMVDGYTTTDNYPYSQRNSLSSLTNDSLAAENKTAKQPNDEINYIRNSVKATVDAYDGKVTLYQWDKNDAMLRAWMSVFPGLVKSADAMPQAVRAHVRYPEDLFEVQRSLLGQYHVDNPITFYNAADKWTVPGDPNVPGSNQPPYYVLASAPGSGITAPQFQLTSPMIVNGKNNLAAYVSVDCDYGTNYGHFTVLKVPTGSVTKGPEQVRGILNSNSTISKDLSLFNSANGGSSVVYGNLLTLPLGNSFLYVEPLYVQAAGGAGVYPILQRVLVVYGSKIGYADTLEHALQNLSDSFVGRNLTGNGNTSGSGGTGGGPSTSPGPGGGSPTSKPPSSGNGPSVSVQQLQAAINEVNNALRREQELLNQYVRQQSSGAPAKSPTPPSGSSATSSPHAPKPSSSSHS